MQRLSLLAMLTIGCGNNPSNGARPPDASTPVTGRGIETCIASGGSLVQAWTAANLHGKVHAIALQGETLTLTSEDGSVKTWNTDDTGTGADYGMRFADSGPVVAALAYTADRLFGVTVDGSLRQWSAATKAPLATTAVGDPSLSLVAVTGEMAIVARGPTDPTIRRVDLATSTPSAPLSTGLWGVGALSIVGTHLYAAGHYYSMASVERWDTTALLSPKDSYIAAESAVVRALAIDPEETTLVAAGDGFVHIMTPSDLAAGPRASGHDPTHHAVGAVLFPAKELVATAGSEGTLQLWRTTGEHVSTLTIPAPVGLVTDADAKTLYTSGADGILRAFSCR